jgi:hypothetical protein
LLFSNLYTIAFNGRSLYITYARSKTIPTTAQAFTAAFLCQLLTNLLLWNIYFFYFDLFSQNIYIIAGRNFNEEAETIDLEIYPNGEWEFSQ